MYLIKITLIHPEIETCTFKFNYRISSCKCPGRFQVTQTQKWGVGGCVRTKFCWQQNNAKYTLHYKLIKSFQNKMLCLVYFQCTVLVFYTFIYSIGDRSNYINVILPFVYVCLNCCKDFPEIRPCTKIGGWALARAWALTQGNTV